VIRAWYDAYCLKNKKGAEQILRSFEIHLFPKIGNLPHDIASLHDWLEVLEPISDRLPGIADRLLVMQSRLTYGLSKESWWRIGLYPI
jgi:hypothetical protein